MALPTFTPKGSHQYNYAINGEPWLAATSPEIPYKRATAQINKNQIDTSEDIGEQSLQGWWYRSQSSFDLGAGAKFIDAKDKTLMRRFFDSHGVDAISTVGETRLLRQSALQETHTSASTQLAIGYSNGGENGVIYAYNNVLKKVTAAGVSTAITWGGSGNILDIATNGASWFVLSTEGIFYGSLPGGSGTHMYRTYNTSGKIEWAKERIIASLDNGLFALAPAKAIVPFTTTNISGDGSKITYTFTTIHGWEVGQAVTVINSNIAGYNVKDAIITSVATNGLSFTVAGTATGTHSGTATVTSLGTPIFVQNTAGWTWTAIADGPNGVYFSGYVGDKSYIYSSNLDEDGLNLSAPSIIAEIPHGEICYTMISYLGTYLMIGTNLGVRVGFITSNSTLVIGNLLIESNNNIKALYARGDYVWAGGAHSGFTVNNDNTITAGKTGIYKISLARQLTQEGFQLPFQKDLYANDITFTETDEVLAITNIGMSGRVAFTVANKGLVFENATNYVTSGWLETGKIRMDTAEDKIFQYLKVTNLTADGAISVNWRDEANIISATPLASWNTDGVRVSNMEGADGQPHPWVSYRFTLTRGNNVTTGATSTPVLMSYQLKAQPATVKQRIIQVNLLCFASEKPVKGLEIKRSVYDRIKALEDAEEKGAVVTFQDFGTGEQRFCLIESLEFTSTHLGDRTAQANPGGILRVTLRAVDTGVGVA